MVASTSLPHDDDDDDEKMPAPHRLIVTYWESDQIREACEKSRAALDDLLKPNSCPTDPTGDHQIRKVAKVENLFLIHKPPEKEDHQRTAYWSYADSFTFHDLVKLMSSCASLNANCSSGTSLIDS